MWIGRPSKISRPLTWTTGDYTPPFLARKMCAGRDSNITTFTQYFQLLSDHRSGACYYVKSLEACQREVRMEDGDIAISSQLF